MTLGGIVMVQRLPEVEVILSAEELAVPIEQLIESRGIILPEDAGFVGAYWLPTTMDNIKKADHIPETSRICKLVPARPWYGVWWGHHGVSTSASGWKFHVPEGYSLGSDRDVFTFCGKVDLTGSEIAVLAPFKSISVGWAHDGFHGVQHCERKGGLYYGCHAPRTGRSDGKYVLMVRDLT